MLNTCERNQVLSIVLILAGLVLLLSMNFPYKTHTQESFLDYTAFDPKMQSCASLIKTVYKSQPFSDNKEEQTRLTNIVSDLSPHTAKVYSELGTVPTLEQVCRIPKSKMKTYGLVRKADSQYPSGKKCVGMIGSDTALELAYHTGDSTLGESSGCLIRLDKPKEEVQSILNTLHKLKYKDQIDEINRLKERKLWLEGVRTSLNTQLNDERNTTDKYQRTYTRVQQVEKPPVDKRYSWAEQHRAKLASTRMTAEENLRSNWTFS